MQIFVSLRFVWKIDQILEWFMMFFPFSNTFSLDYMMNGTIKCLCDQWSWNLSNQDIIGIIYEYPWIVLDNLWSVEWRNDQNYRFFHVPCPWIILSTIIQLSWIYELCFILHHTNRSELLRKHRKKDVCFQFYGHQCDCLWFWVYRSFWITGCNIRSQSTEWKLLTKTFIIQFYPQKSTPLTIMEIYDLSSHITDQSTTTILWMSLKSIILSPSYDSTIRMHLIQINHAKIYNLHYTILERSAQLFLFLCSSFVPMHCRLMHWAYSSRSQPNTYIVAYRRDGYHRLVVLPYIFMLSRAFQHITPSIFRCVVCSQQHMMHSGTLLFVSLFFSYQAAHEMLYARIVWSQANTDRFSVFGSPICECLVNLWKPSWHYLDASNKNNVWER